MPLIASKTTHDPLNTLTQRQQYVLLLPHLLRGMRHHSLLESLPIVFSLLQEEELVASQHTPLRAAVLALLRALPALLVGEAATEAGLPARYAPPLVCALLMYHASDASLQATVKAADPDLPDGLEDVTVADDTAWAAVLGRLDSDAALLGEHATAGWAAIYSSGPDPNFAFAIEAARLLGDRLQLAVSRGELHRDTAASITARRTANGPQQPPSVVAVPSTAVGAAKGAAAAAAAGDRGVTIEKDGAEAGGAAGGVGGRRIEIEEDEESSEEEDIVVVVSPKRSPRKEEIDEFEDEMD